MVVSSVLNWTFYINNDRNNNINNNNLPIKGDSDEGEDADVDTEDLHEWAELAHELRQIPSLKQSCVKLKEKER